MQDSVEIYDVIIKDKKKDMLKNAFKKICKRDEELDQITFMTQDLLTTLNEEVGLI